MKENHFKLADGRQLTWYEIGHGRPLVLLHGWSMSAAVFSEFARLLATEFHLLIPDLPGHGNSSPPQQNDLTGIAADLVHWIAATVY
ncbi:MAG: alpha/beta fold hydrolase, partial [Desulfuromonadales bacterium]